MSRSIDELFSELSAGDEARAEAVIARLSALPIEEAREWLHRVENAIFQAQGDVRWWLVRSLAALPPEIETTTLLVNALADANPSVRQCAALSLREHPQASAVTALITALADADALVSRLCVEALAAIGSEAVPALLETLQTGPQPARMAAVRALAAIGDPRSISALIAVLDDESAIIEYWAGVGLERMGVGMSFFNPE